MATNPSSQPPAVIGSTTTYHGTEHRALHGYLVQVVAVLKNIAPGPDNLEILSTDEAIAQAGGVAIGDRIEVRPCSTARTAGASSPTTLVPRTWRCSRIG